MEGYSADEVDGYDESPTYAGLMKVIRDAVHDVDPRPESPGGEHQSGLGGKVFSHYHLKLAVKKEGQRYLDSNPGIDSAAGNIGLHGAISSLLKDTSNPDIEDLVEMRDSIDYRMNQIMGAATRYKNEWGLDIRDCHFTDVDGYINKGLQIEANMFSLVCKYPLFDEPTELQGRPYIKGKHYITSCILEAGWNPDQAADKLDQLVKYKNKQDLAALRSGVTEAESTNTVMATLRRIFAVSEVPIREELEKISQCTNLRIRSELFSQSPREGTPENSDEDEEYVSCWGCGI
ncbi:hypothetical protein VF21_07810 [Pseudogymnoascus sp. 05NY08]|nr:hypothetical protein VF21_07810 [Pseudogymnoascus sp. 05NY08]